MKARKRTSLIVRLPGRDGYKDYFGKITKEKWTINGKKKDIYVVRDNKNRKLARSTKFKVLKEARSFFNKNGSLTKRYNINYKTNVKEVSVPFKKRTDIKKQPKTRTGNYQIFTRAVLPNGKIVNATSDKYPNSTNIKEAIGEANSRLKKRVDEVVTGGYDAKNGEKILKTKNIKVVIGVKYYSKR